MSNLRYVIYDDSESAVNVQIEFWRDDADGLELLKVVNIVRDDWGALEDGGGISIRNNNLEYLVYQRPVDKFYRYSPNYDPYGFGWQNYAEFAAIAVQELNWTLSDLGNGLSPTPIPDTDGIAEGEDNLYYTEARVEANPAVAANSAKFTYPPTDAFKLANIEQLAQRNVNADWDATSGDAEILNKPSVPSSIVELGDTPSTYGSTGQVLKVNATQDGFDFGDGGGEFTQASVMQATKYNQQSLTTTFSTIINWDSEYYDDGDWFNPSTGVITLTSAGTYLITLDLTTGIANTSTTRSESQVRMMLDGVELQGFRRGLYNRTEGADEASASITLVWKKEDSNPQYITFEAARSFGSAEIAVIDASVAIATLGGATGPEGPQGAAGDTFGVVTSATGRTLALTDNLAYIRSTSSSGVTFTIPPQSSVAWHDDTEIVFEQTGAGQITIAPGAGVTLNTSETALSGQQWAVMGLKRVAEDEWTLTGERQAL
jgi:hypothetical protein